jgi:hypothetical protein
MPYPATTLEFRAVVRKALDNARIKYMKSYTDLPVGLAPRERRGCNVRYVAFDVGSAQHIRPVVEEINKELTAKGFSTRATYLSYYIRGVGPAA